ncbi:hypothetical protein M0811_01780 [Anaeramoeba ignava]|uniref:Uncharacterized protein n=1 Tax=Anaeramoeba ignava TaxID=1746090 RepID=A0A9Q0R9K3_ANAIG|nr:hypothetical protein M0811_01780 [Anaeramoeba ignava]
MNQIIENFLFKFDQLENSLIEWKNQKSNSTKIILQNFLLIFKEFEDEKEIYNEEFKNKMIEMENSILEMISENIKQEDKDQELIEIELEIMKRIKNKEKIIDCVLGLSFLLKEKKFESEIVCEFLSLLKSLKIPNENPIWKDILISTRNNKWKIRKLSIQVILTNPEITKQNSNLIFQILELEENNNVKLEAIQAFRYFSAQQFQIEYLLLAIQDSNEEIQKISKNQLIHLLNQNEVQYKDYIYSEINRIFKKIITEFEKKPEIQANIQCIKILKSIFNCFGNNFDHTNLAVVYQAITKNISSYIHTEKNAVYDLVQEIAENVDFDVQIKWFHFICNFPKENIQNTAISFNTKPVENIIKEDDYHSIKKKYNIFTKKDDIWLINLILKYININKSTNSLLLLLLNCLNLLKIPNLRKFNKDFTLSDFYLRSLDTFYLLQKIVPILSEQILENEPLLFDFIDQCGTFCANNECKDILLWTDKTIKQIAQNLIFFTFANKNTDQNKKKNVVSLDFVAERYLLHLVSKLKNLEEDFSLGLLFQWFIRKTLSIQKKQELKVTILGVFLVFVSNYKLENKLIAVQILQNIINSSIDSNYRFLIKNFQNFPEVLKILEDRNDLNLLDLLRGNFIQFDKENDFVLNFFLENLLFCVIQLIDLIKLEPTTPEFSFLIKEWFHAIKHYENQEVALWNFMKFLPNILDKIGFIFLRYSKQFFPLISDLIHSKFSKILNQSLVSIEQIIEVKLSVIESFVLCCYPRIFFYKKQIQEFLNDLFLKNPKMDLKKIEEKKEEINILLEKTSSTLYIPQNK